MFKSLLKTRLAAFGAYYSGAARRRGGKKKKSGTGSKVLYGLLMVYCFVVFVGMFFALFSTLAGGLRRNGLRVAVFHALRADVLRAHVHRQRLYGQIAAF